MLRGYKQFYSPHKNSDFVKDVEKKLDTSNYELDHSLKKNS